jgi:hypothetical protein
MFILWYTLFFHGRSGPATCLPAPRQASLFDKSTVIPDAASRYNSIKINIYKV